MKRTKVILNPTAGRGYGARSEAEIRRHLTDQQLDFDLVHTKGRGHAIELASAAVNDGYDQVVAAGGDGTFNEVVNGLMSSANGDHSCAMGVIPVGSGSDFAFSVKVSPDLEQACHQVANGSSRRIDIGRVTGPGLEPRYFDNTVGVGFDAIVTYEALKVKWVRGMALYLPVVMKSIFLYGDSPVLTVSYDGQEMTLAARMVTVANGPREGGGFLIAPDAAPDDAMLDLCIVGNLSKMGMLGVIPHFMKGTHVGRDQITVAQARQISISASKPFMAHMDGEMLGTELSRLDFELLPQKLLVKC